MHKIKWDKKPIIDYEAGKAAGRRKRSKGGRENKKQFSILSIGIQQFSILLFFFYKKKEKRKKNKNCKKKKTILDYGLI
jgi:hypothetical protein